MSETLVIIPTYNERESLGALLGRVRQTIPDADVLIIDDSSPDGTGELADQLAESDHAVEVSDPQGHGTHRGVCRENVCWVCGTLRARCHRSSTLNKNDAERSCIPGRAPVSL